MNYSYSGIAPKTVGSWLALLTTIGGMLMPLVPPQHQLAAGAILAGIGTAATKLQ
jgi:hypothetical protein